MTVRINKQKINLREKLTEFEDKVNATQSLDALVDTSRNIDITNLSTSGESIRNTGAIINNRFVPFGPHARVLDLANTPVSGGSADTTLKGFVGGFTDGRYGYFVPFHNGSASHGKIARVDLHDFSSVDVLDLDPNNTDGLKGFLGGFTDGRYGYFVPHNNGKIARVDLSDFSSVDVLDLDPEGTLNPANTNGLKGFLGGFTDGRYGYFVPYHNGSPHGKIARVDLSDFSSVSVLDLTNTPINGGAIDSTLKGFEGGFTDGRYGYFVPYHNGSPHGKIARVDLSDFSSVDVLDLTSTNSFLKGFRGGFTDGRYGYFVPYHNGSPHGKIARVDLNDFSTVSMLDLQSIDPTFAGFIGGFTDGRYGYIMPHYNTDIEHYGKIIRIDLNDFSTVDVLDLNGASGGFRGGFTDGKYGYCVPNYFNGTANGVAARFQLFNGGNF